MHHHRHAQSARSKTSSTLPACRAHQTAVCVFKYDVNIKRLVQFASLKAVAVVMCPLRCRTVITYFTASQSVKLLWVKQARPSASRACLSDQLDLSSPYTVAPSWSSTSVVYLSDFNSWLTDWLSESLPILTSTKKTEIKMRLCWTGYFRRAAGKTSTLISRWINSARLLHWMMTMYIVRMTIGDQQFPRNPNRDLGNSTKWKAQIYRSHITSGY